MQRDKGLFFFSKKLFLWLTAGFAKYKEYVKVSYKHAKDNYNLVFFPFVDCHWYKKVRI